MQERVALSNYERLNNHKAKRDHVHFAFYSMNDDDLLLTFHQDPQVATFIRDHVLEAIIREENALKSKKTRQSTARAKELTSVTKTGTRENIVQYLHTLDDITLIALSKNPSMRMIIEETPALYQRFVSIHEHDEPRNMSQHIREHLSDDGERLVIRPCPMKEPTKGNHLPFSLTTPSKRVPMMTTTPPDSPYMCPSK